MVLNELCNAPVVDTSLPGHQMDTTLLPFESIVAFGVVRARCWLNWCHKNIFNMNGNSKMQVSKRFIMPGK